MFLEQRTRYVLIYVHICTYIYVYFYMYLCPAALCANLAPHFFKKLRILEGGGLGKADPRDTL